LVTLTYPAIIFETSGHAVFAISRQIELNPRRPRSCQMTKHSFSQFKSDIGPSLFPPSSLSFANLLSSWRLAADSHVAVVVRGVVEDVIEVVGVTWLPLLLLSRVLVFSQELQSRNYCSWKLCTM